MKRLLFSLAGLAVLGTVAVQAQNSPGTPAAPHQVGLIDMAHVFKNYQKFTAMTESLQKELEQSDIQAKNLIEQIKQLQGQLSSGDLQEGSPDFARLESQMLKAQTDLETFKRVTQRDFVRKEADIYKTVYLEVEDAVQRYARYYNYTLVMRFNRQKVDEAENPRDIINGMNRQVVFFRAQDDITDPILAFLNDGWKKQMGSSPGATPPATRGTAPSAGNPAGGQVR